MSKPAGRLYQFGPFCVDTNERLLLRKEDPVPLTPKAFETLLLLVRNSGHVLSKAELIKELWPDSTVEENNLTQNISALRKALGEGSQPSYIETIPKLGYRFIGTITESRVIRSVAVLPFKPLSSDDRDEYLGLGIADALITRLGNIKQIIVRPTSAVRRYAGLEQDPLAVGRELRVEAVLEGSIRKLQDRIRVTVQLVSLADTSPLWADTFDERFTDLFTVEDSISKRVAQALLLKLTGDEKRQLSKRYTENREAYPLYLKGRYYWNKRTGETLQKGIEHFSQAIAKDPAYALAYSGLADCLNLLSLYGALPPKEAMTQAKAAAVRALEIDETLAEAHTSLAYVTLYYDWNWPGAEKEFRRALELNPNYATAHHWYHEYLTAMGRFEEGLAAILRAQDLDPLSLIIKTDVGWGLYFARRHDRAIEQLREALEMDPNFVMAHFILGLCFVQKRMFDKGLDAIHKAIALSGDSPLSLALGALGNAYALSGRKDEAGQALDRLKDQSKRRYVPSYSLAMIYAGLGQADQAIKWLRKALEERNDRLIYLNVDPMFDNLRSDPRFTELIMGVGLSLPNERPKLL